MSAEAKAPIDPDDKAEAYRQLGLRLTHQRDGTWDKILSALQAAGDATGRIGWTVSVDSMTSRAHQHPPALAPTGIGRRSGSASKPSSR